MSLNFAESVYAILLQVKEHTGKEVVLVEKADLSTYAAVKIARKSMPAHIMYYKPEHSGILNHLLAHECGHILRIYGVPEKERFIGFTNDQIKLKALSAVESDVEKLSKSIPFKRLVDVVNIWYNGVIKQLTSYPSDVQIERWIYDSYPKLRAYQFQSLTKQYSEAVVGLSVDIEKTTPRLILDASNGMNYAFFTTLQGHLIEEFHMGRYNRSAYVGIGKQLIKAQQEADNTYAGDMETTNRWAEILHLSGWFGWRDFEDMPDNYLASFS